MAVSAAPVLQLTEYLEKLPGTTFRKLYQQPSTALAIFRRMLPEMAQVIALSVLYQRSALLLSDLDNFVAPDQKK